MSKFCRALLVSALLGAGGAAQAQETIKVGVIQPLTGSVADNGLAFVNGAKRGITTVTGTPSNLP